MSRSPALLWAMLATLWLTGCAEGVNKHFFVNPTGQVQLKVVLQGNLDSDVLILVLHGGPVGSSHIYNQGAYARALEERYAVAWLDQRGQGGSQGRFDTDAYGVLQAADDVDAVVDVLRGRFGQSLDIYLLGHSWGGMLGTLALLETDAPDQVTGWIETAGCHDSLLEPRYVVSRLQQVGQAQLQAGVATEDWDEILAFVDGFDPEAAVFDSEDLHRLNTYGYRAEGLIEEIDWEDPTAEALWAGLADAQRDSISAFSASASLDTLYAQAEVTSLTDRLGEIAVPGLYLYGRYDFICPTQLGRVAAEANTSEPSRFVELQASGHSLMSNEPETFVAEITDFVQATRR